MVLPFFFCNPQDSSFSLIFTGIVITISLIMKTLSSFFFASLLMLFTATCGNVSEEEDQSAAAVINETSMEITGIIQPQGMTSYQYGTHTITTANDEYYALKSEEIDLDDYVDKKVTVVAEKIDGYPLSGGPDYLLVLEVKED